MHIVRSTIAGDEILGLIKNKYGYRHSNATCMLEYRGVNDIYRYNDGSISLYLKIYARTDLDREAIQAEVDIVNDLHQSGLRVAHPIATLDKGYLLPFDVPEGRRYGVLYAQADGIPCDNDALDDQEPDAIGRLLATMHAMLDAMPTSPRRWTLDEHNFP
jgi:Ser/Thr protein kinase RdoA (MazF antagonist)